MVTELARLVDDVDAVDDGRTALWLAVHAGKPDNARALVVAGADPERPMMAGWSPARLSLAGATPDLFDTSATLTEAEAAAVAHARRLIHALADLDSHGMSLCCVGGIDAAEATRRLNATVVEDDIEGGMRGATDDESIRTLGVTDVPGGCVVSQPWAYGASMPLVALLLSAGTICYGMYANPKSGNQGASVHDGVITGWDLHPGGGWSEADNSRSWKVVVVMATTGLQDRREGSRSQVAGARKPPSTEAGARKVRQSTQDRRRPQSSDTDT